MKSFLLSSVIVCSSLVLVSCGSDNSSDIVITPDTPIENSAQSAKVCEPFMKYLQCSLEKAPAEKKSMHEKIIKDTQRRIDNDEPARVAQECETYIKVLKNNADLASKNGCFVETPKTEESPATEKSPEETPKN